MNVTVDIENDCPKHWVPKAADMCRWINSANEIITPQAVPINISVRVVTEQDSAKFNQQYRGNDKPTNVLSFACELPATITGLFEFTPLGDIAICASILEAEAKQQGKSLESHWAHLLTHGFLHLNGYQHDNESDADKMEALEVAVLNKLGFPNPYLLEEPLKLTQQGDNP